MSFWSVIRQIMTRIFRSAFPLCWFQERVRFLQLENPSFLLSLQGLVLKWHSTNCPYLWTVWASNAYICRVSPWNPVLWSSRESVQGQSIDLSGSVLNSIFPWSTTHATAGKPSCTTYLAFRNIMNCVLLCAFAFTFDHPLTAGGQDNVYVWGFVRSAPMSLSNMKAFTRTSQSSPRSKTIMSVLYVHKLLLHRKHMHANATNYDVNVA